MATPPRKISVRTTAGRNARVDNVLRLEDLLLRAERATPKAKPDGPQAEARRLAAELAQRLRPRKAVR